MLTKFFFYNTYKRILATIPKEHHHLFKWALILGTIRSVLDVAGLAIIVPVIQVIIRPAIIQDNKLLHALYIRGGFTSVSDFGLVLMTAVFCFFIFKTFASYYLARAQALRAYHITEEISLRRFLSYLHMPYGYYLENNTSHLIRNFLYVPFEFGQRVLLPFIQMAGDTFLIILIFISMLVYEPVLFLSVMVLLVPFVALYQNFLRNKLKDISTKKDTSSKAIFKDSSQAMQVFREIILFRKFNYFKNRYLSGLHNLIRLNARINTINEFSPKMIELIAVTGIMIVFLFSWFIQKGNEELVQFLLVFALATSRLLPSSNRIILFSSSIRSNAFTFEYLSNIIPMKDIRDTEDREVAPQPFEREIEIKNLAFGYAEAKEPLFSGLSLTINKGESIGIIGSSGSGKTTLLNLLLRLYDETEGGVMVDGVKIDTTNRDNWYRLIGFVPQNITLLDGNFIDNIAFGIPQDKVNLDKLNDAIHRAGLDELVKQAAQGLETNIGEGGMRISGGQRQRIGIARALYTDARILIFDEATSSLDSQTEEQVTEAIKTLSKNELTIIIVAHRLQTLKYCNAIYKIEEGKLSKRLMYADIQSN